MWRENVFSPDIPSTNQTAFFLVFETRDSMISLLDNSIFFRLVI